MTKTDVIVASFFFLGGSLALSLTLDAVDAVPVPASDAPVAHLAASGPRRPELPVRAHALHALSAFDGVAAAPLDADVAEDAVPGPHPHSGAAAHRALVPRGPSAPVWAFLEVRKFRIFT